jgi:hypothetical protein
MMFEQNNTNWRERERREEKTKRVFMTLFSGFQFVSVRGTGIVDLVMFVMVATV